MSLFVRKWNSQSAVADEIIGIRIGQYDVFPFLKLFLELLEASYEQSDADAKWLDIYVEPSVN